MVTEQQVDYGAELGKLPPEEREQYLSGWRDYFGKLPKQAYIGQLTRLTQQYGPEFTSQLIQPELITEKAEAPPITEVPAEAIEPEVPWYQKPLFWAAEQEALKPAFRGLEAYYSKWLTPAAMTIAQAYAPKLREELKDRRPFDIEEGERRAMWEESGLPWLTRTATELAVDPLAYFGWGLAPRAFTAVKGAGFPTIAKAIKPLASVEEAYIRAAQKPIRGAAALLKKAPAVIPDIAELRAGRWVLRKPLEESPKSTVRTVTLQTANALHNLDLAGDITGKPFSQILQDLNMGIPDPALIGTLKHPRQLQAIQYIAQNAKRLGLDEIIRVADINPITAGVVVAQRVSRLLTQELGIQAPTIATGALGVAQRLSTKLYTTWKKTVLQTPWYVAQNTVENPLREIMVGVTPMWDITDLVKTPGFKDWPMEMQMKAISLGDRWNKTIPETALGAFARTPMLGGMTEASIGALAIGKTMPASTVAAFMDDTAIVNTYRHWNNKFVRNIMETTSPETQAALTRISGLYDDALKQAKPDIEAVDFLNTLENSLRVGGGEKPGAVARAISDIEAGFVPPIRLSYERGKFMIMDGRHRLEAYTRLGRQQVPIELDRLAQEAFTGAPGVGVVEPKLLEHLKEISTSGSVDDVISAFSEIQRNKTLTIARAMSDLERQLPDVVRSKIKVELPRLWAKNDVQGIHRLFEELKRTMPQRIETYQKQLMVQRIRAYRDMLRTSVPKPYQPYITKILNRFRYERVSESEAALASAKSVNEFERAMFNAHKASRRELEMLAEWNMVTEAAAKNIPPETLGHWFVAADEINRIAFNEGDVLVQKTLSTANTIRFGKDPAAIKTAWDSYIMEIQSLTPDLADAMRVVTPNTDTLWHTYRGVQEQRWFKVGQDKLRATGIDVYKTPRVTGPGGKILTQEDFLQSQLGALKGWEDRTVAAWDKRHITPTAKNKLLDNLREETIRAKEAISLQELQIRNEASRLALDTTYTTFGNYAQRTNLDEFMQGIGVPFWFFPSRSIPFYVSQMIQRPKLGLELLNMQQSEAEAEQPSRLFGTVNIPGTNFWYNPIGATMLWQLADRRNFIPAAMGGLEQGQDWMRNTLAVSLGPQWRIATAIVERVMGKQTGETVLTMEPAPIVPQQRWLDAVAGLKLPVISPAAALLNEPFDMYLRAVYGDTVADWQKREVEKTIVDMGHNPQDAPDEVIKAAWDKYYIRQLLSIPGGAVKEMTPTEMARFEAISDKAKEMGLTKEQRVSLRQMGESPFTGLRQDQIEALYADVPAQKLWRYIRPWGLTTKTRPIWDDYIQFKLGRETLFYGADKDNPTEGSRLYKERQFDKALQQGRISPREWKSLYRQNYADYISKVEQLELDYPQAPKTDQDWEAYRELLGWDEPVRHPDDIKLDEYYEAMESSKFENDLGEFDYGAYRKAEATFLQGLTPDTIAYIRARKDRYKSPLRAAYTRDMEKVQPYFDLQDAILAQYPPEIATVIEYALASPDPAIQRAILVGHPQAMIALRRIRIAKAQLRMRNPEMDKTLRFWSS